MILYENKLFDKDECEFIKSLGGEFEQSYFEAGTHGEIAYNLKRRNSFLTNAILNNDTPIFKKIAKVFNGIGLEIIVDKLPFEIYKYNQGNFIVKHSDDDKFTHKRFGAVVVQLNESDEYTGGDFLYYVNETPIAISREIGTCLIMTTEVPHEVEMINSGERKSMIITFYNGYLKPVNQKKLI